MDADWNKNQMRQLTEKVIQCAFTISNTLGCGFLGKVYENALAHELRNYLKATNLRLCLLMNFGKPKVEIRRIANSY